MTRVVRSGACALLVALVGALSMSTAFAATGPITVTTAGTTLVAPNVACTGDPAAAPGNLPKGITIRASNVTVVNPKVTNCQRGISIEKTSTGAIPSNVRIIGDASRPGYSVSELRHNRNSIFVQRLYGGEIGDVSEDGTDGGRPFINDTWKFVEVEASQNLLIDDLTGNCGTTVWKAQWNPGNKPGCFFGIKWLSKRATGAPHLISSNTVSDVRLTGVTEETISFDGHFNTANMSSNVATDTVASRDAGANRLGLSDADWASVTENLTGQYVNVVDGTQQGKYLRILSRSKNTFTVDDPNNVIGAMANGNKVSVGQTYAGNRVLSNTINSQGGKVHIDFHVVGVNSRIAGNTLTGTNSFRYGAGVMHLRQLNGTDAPQCINVRTGFFPPASIGGKTVGIQRIGLSANNSVVGNSCQHGDISLTLATWTAPPSGFTSQNYWASNTFSNGQLVTYQNRLLATDGAR